MSIADQTINNGLEASELVKDFINLDPEAQRFALAYLAATNRGVFERALEVGREIAEDLA